MQRLQLPFLIVLELLALVLLGIAAAQPMLRIESLGRPTAIILDASYSMNAADADNATVQKRALDDLQRMLAGRLGSQPIGFPIQFIVAGLKPRLLPGRARNGTEAAELLKAWNCEAPTADLDAAVSLASNISTPGTKILVVTDNAPESEIAEGRVLWKAYGKKRPNFAVIHASRVYREEKDRLLLEIANLSDTPQMLRMAMIDSNRKRVLFQDEKSLEAGQTHLIRTGIPDGVESLEVRVDDDGLTLDNQLTILPPSRKPVRVQIAELPDALEPKIRKAVEATGIAVMVDERPEIVFGESDTTENAWQVHFVTEQNLENIKPFIGPFIIDHASPLATGLSLDGVIWSASDPADENATDVGLPVVSAGDVPLLSERRRRNGSRDLTFNYDDRLSTLTSGPAWPILIWNILQYRASRTVGFAVNNLKLGTEAEFVPSGNDTLLEIVTPRGETQEIEIASGSVRVPADHVGVYKAKTQSGSYEFAVGTLSTEESNLLHAETATVGNWFDEETLRSDFRPVAWMLMLTALAALTTHLWCIASEKPEIQFEKQK